MKAETQYIKGRQSGSAILMGLILLAMVSFGMAAWMSLIHTRSYFVEQMENSIKRRVAYQNGCALAEEYLYYNALTKTDGNAVNVELANGMGAIDIPAWVGAPLGSNLVPGSINRIGPAEGSGFTQDIEVTIADGTETSTRTYQMRSRNPMLSGDLLTIQQPGGASTSDRVLKGNILVHGRSVIWHPNNFNEYEYAKFRSDEYNTPTVGASGFAVQEIGGGDVLMRNFPAVPVTSGEFGTTLGYDGKTAVVSNASSAFNSLHHKVLASNHIEATGSADTYERGVDPDGNGNVTIDLNDASLTNVFLNNNIRNLVLVGQDKTTAAGQALFDAADSLDAVVITLVQDSSSLFDLNEIQMQYSNNRRLVLAIKSTDDDDYATFYWENAVDTPDWRMMLVGENTRFRLRVRNTGTVHMTGGIRAERRVHMDTNSAKVLHIHPELDPGPLLEQMSDRNGWLESFGSGVVDAASDPFGSYNSPYTGPGGGSTGGDGGDGGDGSDGGDDGSTGGAGGDITPPTVVLSTPLGDVAGDYVVTATFSEPVSGVGPSDFMINNGSLGSLGGSGQAYTFTITPINLGPIDVTMLAGTCEDAAGNGNIPSNTLITTFVGPITLVQSSFDSGEDGWTYADDTFRGTTWPIFADGYHLPAGGQSGGGLEVFVGGVSGFDANNMSGGYSKTFTLDVASTVTLQFDVFLLIAYQYESNEYGESLASINGNLIYFGGNDYIDRLVGGNYSSDLTVPWKTVNVSLGSLPAGNHTVTLGGYNNRKTTTSEHTNIRYDNVTVTASYP